MDMDDHKPETHRKNQVVEGLDNEDDTFSQRSYHGRFGFYYRHSKFLNHLLTFFICTGLFVPAVVIHKEGNILVLSLLYAAVVWWLLLQHLPDGTLSRPIVLVWSSGARLINMLPSIFVKVVGYGIPPVALILTAALRADDAHGTRVQRLISCLGLVVLLLVTIAFSKVILVTTSSRIPSSRSCGNGQGGFDLPFGLPRPLNVQLDRVRWILGPLDSVHEDVLWFLPLDTCPRASDTFCPCPSLACYTEFNTVIHDAQQACSHKLGDFSHCQP